MWTVEWMLPAQQRLSELWIQSTVAGQQRLFEVIRTLDRRLNAAADSVGESRDPDRRVLIELPVGIEYFVDPGARVAKVTRVWLIDEFDATR